MKKQLFILTLGISVLMGGCSYNGMPVDYANICSKENDDKLVEVVSFLDNSGSAMCSKSRNDPMRCPIWIKGKLEDENTMLAYIDLGSGASEIGEPAKGEGLKIKDDKGEYADRTQKLKVTGYVTVYDSTVGDPKSAGCSITVKKIEKAE